MLLFSSIGWKGNFIQGALAYRQLYYFTGSTYSNSQLSWSGIDINSNHYRTISPRTRSYGIGVYGQDTMSNLFAFRGANNRTGSGLHWYSNNGVSSGSASASQMTSLGTRPSIFWDGRSGQYAFDSSAAFLEQNNSHFYSVWRLNDGSNVISDIVGGSRGALILRNTDTNWDDQLFAVNGQGRGNTPNGSPLSKIILTASYTDFSIARPLIMSLVGGLPRQGGDVVSKEESDDAYWRTGNYDYYLNYYPKYDGASKKLLAKDDGYDWAGLSTRIQIDGTKTLPEISASAESFVRGYSKVGEIAYT